MTDNKYFNRENGKKNNFRKEYKNLLATNLIIGIATFGILNLGYSNTVTNKERLVAKEDTHYEALALDYRNDISIRDGLCVDLLNEAEKGNTEVFDEINTQGTSEKFTYISSIPMPKEHQQFLFTLCQEIDLDYLHTLALLKHESQFDYTSVSSTNDYGYMQVNKVNHGNLAKTLGTNNEPLNPYVNMRWGTYMLKEAYRNWEDKGLSEKELFECALSTYNKGLRGFKVNGKAVAYISKVSAEIEVLESLINKEKE